MGRRPRARAAWPPLTVGPYITSPSGPRKPIVELGWLRAALGRVDWVLGMRARRALPPLPPARRMRPTPTPRRRRPQPGSSRPRVPLADTPPVMLTWVTAGAERLAGPEPLELPAPGLARIHAAAIATADVRPRAIGWRARRRPREPAYCPLYDGVAEPDPLDVAHRQWSARGVAARRRHARLAR
jgi:hypothetical protein